MLLAPRYLADPQRHRHRGILDRKIEALGNFNTFYEEEVQELFKDGC